jgi:hypothetical protein
MKHQDLSKTMSAGIVSATHRGGLLGRIVQKEGVLMGQTVMVTNGCRCVVVAGDQVTAVLQEGPHTLELSHFNRQPAAFLYTVPTEPDTVSWFPINTTLRRTAVLRVEQPEPFVQQLVIAQGLEETGEVVAYLGNRIDTWILPGHLSSATKAAHASVLAFLLQHGLILVAFDEVEAQSPPPLPPPVH